MTTNIDVNQSIRLDKWLWAARLYKTRALAKEMVSSGKVRYNDSRSKPSRVVEIGSIITVPQGYEVKQIVVVAISDKRGSADIARHLYCETSQSVADREARKQSVLHQPVNPQRPNKKQRRKIIEFKLGNKIR
jgi:ribosome-associated heat shock protein Hsp15